MPRNQTLKGEHDRRLGLVATWVVEFPQEGKSEKALDCHIQREFGVSRYTSFRYRQLARQQLGAAVAGLESLAGMLLEWGEANYERIERSAVTAREKIKLTTALISVLAKLCPRHVFNYQSPDTPPCDPEEQARFLRGEGPAPAGTNGEGGAAAPRD
jgi:hypothetical protein